MSEQRRQGEDRQTELARLLRQRVSAPLARCLAAAERGEPVDRQAIIAEAMAGLREAIGLVGGKDAGQGLVGGQDEGESDETTPASSALVQDLAAGYWQQQQRRRGLAGTGFGKLDKALMGGLESGRLYVLLGAPGSGKTTLANQLADWLAAEHPVLYVTFEDSPYTLFCKNLARRGDIEYQAVLFGYRSEQARIQAALDEYAATPQAKNLRYLDAAEGVCLQTIVEQAQEHFAQCQERCGDAFPVLVLDYLQQLARAEDRYIRRETGGAGSLGADMRLAVTTYTDRLKQLAKELGAAVVAISAMNRSGGYSASLDRSLNAAKESGDIEYSADFVAALGTEPDETGSIELAEPGTFAWRLTIAKNRQGLTAMTGADIPLRWVPAYQRFDQRERVSGEETGAGGDETVMLTDLLADQRRGGDQQGQGGRRSRSGKGKRGK